MRLSCLGDDSAPGSENMPNHSKINIAFLLLVFAFFNVLGHQSHILDLKGEAIKAHLFFVERAPQVSIILEWLLG